MEKVRIGNDMRVNFSVYRNGEPESFDGASNIVTKLVNEAYNKLITHTYTIAGNIVQFDIDALQLTQCGKCRLFISYTKGGDYTVDSPAFELVNYLSAKLLGSLFIVIIPRDKSIIMPNSFIAGVPKMPATSMPVSSYIALTALDISLFGSTDDYTPMTEIDMGYNDDKATSFKLYPDKGELNWADIFTRASFTWLTDPYFKVRSIIKGGSDINVENLSETGTLAFAEATGVDNAGSYLLATINNSTLYVGNNSATVRLNVGQGSAANNTFGLKNFDKIFNLKIKERVHFDSEYITIFGAAASESNTLELQSYQPKIRPSNAETFVGKFPPYVNARYTIAGNLSIVAQQAGIELYVTRTTVTDEAEIAQAVSNGTAFKIANLTYYNYVSPSYLYPISYNGTFPFSIVDDTYYLVILIVNNII